MHGTFTVVCWLCEAPMTLGLDGRWHCQDCCPTECRPPRPTLYDWTQEKDTNG